MIIKKSLLEIENLKEFIEILESLGSFFSKSTKLKDFLKIYTTKKLPKTIKTRWMYHGRLINRVLSEYNHLIACLKDIKENKKFKISSRAKAMYYLDFLSQEDSKMLLKITNVIFCDANKIFSILQKKQLP